MSAVLQFKISNKKQLDILFAIEKQLSEAGITFDTGYDTVNDVREWFLDWSLKGAEIKIIKERSKP